MPDNYTQQTDMKNRTIWIGVALVGALVLAFFIGRTITDKKKVSSTREQAEAKIQKQRLTLHQVCRYADSVGIDTSRFATKSTDSETVLTRQINAFVERSPVR